MSTTEQEFVNVEGARNQYQGIDSASWRPTAGILEQSTEARNQVGIELYQLAELVSWNQFLGSLKGSGGSIRGNKERASKVLYIYFGWRVDRWKQSHICELAPTHAQ
jgi:hypothetical protein